MIIIIRNLLHKGLIPGMVYFIAENIAKKSNIARNTLCVLSDNIENHKLVKLENINSSKCFRRVPEPVENGLVDFGRGSRVSNITSLKELQADISTYKEMLASLESAKLIYPLPRD